MFCTKCGTENADEAKFCSSCGNGFEGIQTKGDVVDNPVQSELNRGDDEFYGLKGDQTKEVGENNTKESVKGNRIEKSPSVGRKIWLGFCYSFGLLLVVGFIGSQFEDEASSSTSSSANQTISNPTSETLNSASVDITTQTIVNIADLFKSTGIPVCLTYAGLLENIAYSGMPASVKERQSDTILDKGYKYGCY